MKLKGTSWSFVAADYIQLCDKCSGTGNYGENKLYI